MFLLFFFNIYFKEYLNSIKNDKRSYCGVYLNIKGRSNLNP
jgi:hypothetical protein